MAKKGSFSKLADFLVDAQDSTVSSKESMERLAGTIAAQMVRADRAKKQEWMGRARLQRTRFESAVGDIVGSAIKQFGNRKALVEAITRGGAGERAQRAYQLHFRNRSADQISDEELRSILSDQETLKLLRK